jgi:DNA-binding NtrC family response regulator
MIADRTDSTEAADPVRQGRPEKPSSAGTSLPLPKAKQPDERVDHLIDLAQMLLSEAEILAGDKSFVDESRRLEALNISEGIDFFDELKRFEISLIRLALAQTSGHQARAAKLLKMNPTTLNTKIKLFGIEY